MQGSYTTKRTVNVFMVSIVEFFFFVLKILIMEKLLTKNEVGAKNNPPKNPSRPPKKGRQTPIKIVKPVTYIIREDVSM